MTRTKDSAQPQLRRSKRARNENGENCGCPVRPEMESHCSGSSTEAGHVAPKAVEDIGITELLDLDSRPTFIIDLHQLVPNTKTDQLPIVYCNTSLRFFDDLRTAVSAPTFYPPAAAPKKQQESMAAADVSFKEWCTSVPDFDNAKDGYLPRHTFRGMFWTCATLRGRWRVISASQVPKQGKQSHGTPRSSRSNSRSTSSSTPIGLGADGDPGDESVVEEDTLSKQLADSESKFKVLTELNPVGMYYLSPGGNILYCNDMWYEITGHPRGLEGEMSFMNVISESEHPLMYYEWDLLTNQKGRRTFELKLRKPWVDEKTQQQKQKWILCSCDQEWDENGNLQTIMGCITDISVQKHAEEDALLRVDLVEKLALTTQEAAQHLKNFQQMAELAPCGMFTFDPEGTITWANSQWYEMTGHPRNAEEHYPMSFLNTIEQQDRDLFHDVWKKLTIAKEEVTLEVRLKKPWIRQESNEAVRDAKWILFLALPQLDDDGNLSKVLGCTTDISGFKFAEHVQMLSRLQAEEAKCQQETFIDMTSHEMRNPLSAIMLCAEGIADSVLEYQKTASNQHRSISKELLENNLDGAQTIVLCAQHQKRIIDDVLMLSKLNSTILHVTPVQVQVESTVRRTLKMFESELQAHNIEMNFAIQESYQISSIDWVFCDPVRLTQIFINLLTNAIKFTRTEPKRSISVKLGASISKPPKDVDPEICWFPSKDSNSIQDLTLHPDWGTGQQVYLYFAVKDTGRGLSEDEKTRLFHRFSQASPRTHVQYGGSGLGLFISRELTELQGGEIGVASAEREGSTFAFYIKARKTVTSSSPEILNNNASSSISTPTAIPADTPQILTKLTRPTYHILLVEDNLINQKVLSKQLRSAGCVVHVANHGGEALDFISKTSLFMPTPLPSHTVSSQTPSQIGHRTTSPNPKANAGMELSLILMDLEMPVMDGLQCARRIRDLEREGGLRRHVPIIAVTANTRGEQMERAMESGMDDIVAKPFQIPELMQKMDQLMMSQGS